MSIMLEKIIQESAEDKITISHNIHKKKSSTICIFQNNSLLLQRFRNFASQIYN